jgi:hypothetical protein
MGFTPLEEQLKDAAQWSLDNYIISNAIFLAERLNTEPSMTLEDKEAKLAFLGRCYMTEQ